MIAARGWRGCQLRRALAHLNGSGYLLRMALNSALLACALAAGLLAGAPARAQSVQPNPPPAPPASSASLPDAPVPSAQASGPAAGAASTVRPSPKRILDIIPNFTVIDQPLQNARPLDPEEKFRLSAEQMFDFSAHLGNLFQSGIQQATNGEPHYGQGWGAFAERFGAAEGDQVTSSFFITGALPVLLKQDPRYFRRGQGRFYSRLGYAISRTLVTRKDDGADTFNTSQTVGQLLSSSMSNLYYPRIDRDVRGTFTSWTINLFYNSGYNALREFYPDLLHLILPHPDKSAPPPVSWIALASPS